jgi:uncharacterized protein (DUF885 family)
MIALRSRPTRYLTRLKTMKRITRIITVLGTAFAVLAACSLEQQRTTSPAAPGAITSNDNKVDAALIAYLDQQYEQETRESPERMTSRGRKDRYSELDDRSEAAQAAQLEWRRRSVAEMKAKFDPKLLSDEVRLSYDVWELELKRAEEGEKWRRHRYIFARGGAPTGLPNFLINQHRVDDKSDMDAYIARVGRIDDVLDQLLVRAKAAAGDGIHMPLFTYDQSLGEIQRITTGAPFSTGADSALLADAKTKIGKLTADGKLSTDQAQQLTQKVADVMVREMKPAYDRVAAFLLEDKPKAQQPQKQGALALPDGAKFYETALYLQTTTRLTADQIHQLGLSEVARLRAEMEQAKVAAGFTGTLEVLPAERRCRQG